MFFVTIGTWWFIGALSAEMVRVSAHRASHTTLVRSGVTTRQTTCQGTRLVKNICDTRHLLHLQTRIHTVMWRHGGYREFAVSHFVHAWESPEQFQGFARRPFMTAELPWNANEVAGLGKVAWWKTSKESFFSARVFLNIYFF